MQNELFEKVEPGKATDRLPKIPKPVGSRIDTGLTTEAFQKKIDDNMRVVQIRESIERARKRRSEIFHEIATFRKRRKMIRGRDKASMNQRKEIDSLIEARIKERDLLVDKK